MKPEWGGRKKMKIRTKMSEIVTRKKIEKKNIETELVFQKMSKIDKPLATLTKKKTKRFQINKIINEWGDIMTDT